MNAVIRSDCLVRGGRVGESCGKTVAVAGDCTPLAVPVAVIARLQRASKLGIEAMPNRRVVVFVMLGALQSA
jgi:hypothetical protein